MKPRIFIDGEAGTTGLEISERLAERDDLTLLRIDPGLRKDEGERRRLFEAADLTILCLPDAASRQAVELGRGSSTKWLDASTAHRTVSSWVYGFPELDRGQRAAIQSSSRVANPGCYATGFIALLRPLVAGGLVAKSQATVCQAISGYSGGGRNLIARFEAPGAPHYGVYALGLDHKHLPEMRVLTGLDQAPLFMPSVGTFRRGMLVVVPLELKQLAKTVTLPSIWETLARHYEGEPLVRVRPLNDETVLQYPELVRGGMLDAEALNGTDLLELFAFGSAASAQCVLVARLDNLGKGASGAAVQNMNLMLGLPENTGLKTERPAG